MSPDRSALISSAAKDVVQLMADIKSLKATVSRKFVFDADSPPARSFKDQLGEYRDKVHGNPGHSLGPPDVWLWTGVVLCCCDQPGKMGESALEAHRTFTAHPQTCLPGGLSRLIFHCELGDCYVQEFPTSLPR